MNFKAQLQKQLKLFITSGKLLTIQMLANDKELIPKPYGSPSLRQYLSVSVCNIMVYYGKSGPLRSYIVNKIGLKG